MTNTNVWFQLLDSKNYIKPRLPWSFSWDVHLFLLKFLHSSQPDQIYQCAYIGDAKIWFIFFKNNSWFRIFFFFGILAAFALNSSNSLIHTRNALEIKPTKVISVYSSRSEIIHVLLALVRSWGKLFAHTHWHIFRAFHTSQWNYTRNMNLDHTACVCCAVCIVYTHMPQQTLWFKFQKKPFKTLLCNSLYDCTLYAFLENERVFCECSHFTKIFDLGLFYFIFLILRV